MTPRSKPRPSQDRRPDDKQRAPAAAEEERGTNEVEREPDDRAEPLPDPQHKHIPRSPYTTGNY